MIIIKTSNGDVLVNEQQMKMVEHDHANHVVRLTDTSGTMRLAMRHPYVTIERVEGIIYTNNAQPTEWKDEGSLVKSLQGIIDRQKYDLGFWREMIKRLQSDLRHYSSKIIQIINYHTKEEMSNDIANRIRNEVETMKDKGNENLWEYRHPYDKEHEGVEYTERKVIQIQNEQIETLSRSVSELKDEMETMRRRHAIHVTDIYARSLWQRILNKTVEP